MGKLLSEDISRQITELFAQIQNPVHVLFFGKKDDCQFCEDARQMLEEVTALSDQITISYYDIDEDAAVAQQYKVDKAPGLVLAGREGDQILDYGIRFAGIPSGHEFSSLIHDLILVSSRSSGLTDMTREVLKGLNEPIVLQVFVTPT